MTVGLVLGLAIGLGLATTARGLLAPRESLQLRLSELDNPADGDHARTRRDRLGRSAAAAFKHFGLRKQMVQADLRAAGRSLEQFTIAKLAMLTLGAGLPVGVWIATWAAQVWISPALVVLASTSTAGLLFFAPDLALREEARKRRRELRHQVCIYLDLVGLHLSGGAGMERALQSSANQGTAWGFVEIQRALGQAELTNEQPWEALDKLGRELGAADLEELAAWLSLAGKSGAPVGSSLHVKARGLRELALNEAETAAQQATERMSLPVVLLFSGFLGLIGYPAIAAIAVA